MLNGSSLQPKSGRTMLKNVTLMLKAQKLMSFMLLSGAVVIMITGNQRAMMRWRKNGLNYE